MSFSPDATKLYYHMKRRKSKYFDLIQVNIIDKIPDFNNFKIIYTHSFTGVVPFNKMQLGLDGKIYQIFYMKRKINIINSPNSLGTLCNYQDNAISLLQVGNNTPNFIINWFSPNSCELDFSYLADCSLAKTFTINNTTNIQSVLWDFGDGTNSTEQNPIHEYATAGIYTVTLTVTYQDSNTQTITKEIDVFGKPPKLIIEHD